MTLTFLDRAIVRFDRCIKTFLGHPEGTTRPDPAQHIIETPLSRIEKAKSAGLMRVNHAGEVCAQALYLGQAFGTQNQSLKSTFFEAAREESDHLTWCKKRLDTLASHTSYLNPFWYTGSFILGTFASRCGDGWSLGFLEETEKQVVDHLKNHLSRLPADDHASHAIVGQMIQDETNHATTASHLGAYPLPAPIRFTMKCMAKIMTTVTYYV
ncbi:MAG: 2-polyprenyl-3-methyl-6-methoxy-1,4-benzoquinone monooxygenase [Gammaproteobacteria bacterium]